MAEATTSQDGCKLDWTPTAALEAGQVIQISDGRAGYAVDAIPAGELGAVQVEGVVSITKATSMVVLKGSRMYWDHSANAAHLLQRNDRDFYVGQAIEDAAAADTTVKLALNVMAPYTIAIGDGFAAVKVLTNGNKTEIIGHREGVTLILDTTNEAQKMDALSIRGVAVGTPCIVEALICVNTNADASAGDLNIGLANATHASDADSITESLFVHIDGGSVNINIESDDGTTEVAATDSTVDFTAGTPFLAQFDLRDDEDIQVYIDGVNVLPSSVFKLNAATGPLKLLAHFEKSADDSPGNVTVMTLGLRSFEE